MTKEYTQKQAEVLAKTVALFINYLMLVVNATEDSKDPEETLEKLCLAAEATYEVLKEKFELHDIKPSDIFAGLPHAA